MTIEEILGGESKNLEYKGERHDKSKLFLYLKVER